MPASKHEEKVLNAETLKSEPNTTLNEENLKTSAGEMHLAGFCAYGAPKRQPRDDCRTQLTIENQELEENDHLLIDSISREGLKFPKPLVVCVVVSTKVVLTHLTGTVYKHHWKAINCRPSRVICSSR